MLVILLIITTGVLRRAIWVTRGLSISSMVVRTTTLSTSQTMCVLFGLF